MITRLTIALLLLAQLSAAQKQNDATSPLHALQPDYAVPYTVPSTANIKATLDRVFNYLDAVTPYQFVNRKTGEVFQQLLNPDTNIVFQQADFRLTSYEWGVTYAGMTRVGEVTKDERYFN